MAKTIEQIGAEFKKSYPQYAGIPDSVVGQRAIERNPNLKSIPAGWDVETYNNFKKANPTLEPDEEDTQNMLNAGQMNDGALTINSIGSNQPVKPAIGKLQSFAQTIASPFKKGVASALNVGESIYDLARGDVAGADQAIRKERDFGYLGKARPITVGQNTGKLMTTGQGIKDIVGTGAEIGSWIAPASVGGKILAKGVAPTVGRLAGGGALSGFLGSGGESLQNAETFGQGVKNTLVGTALGAVAAPVIGKGLEKLRTSIIPKAVTSTADNLGFVGAVDSGVKAVDNITSTPAIPNPRKSVISSSSDFISGGVQKTKEQFQKIPTALKKAGESIQESAQKAERIKNATPAVQKAIKTNLKDTVITAVENADLPTLKDKKVMLDIAESGSKTTRPEKIAGDAGAKQYKLVDKELKNIGKQIGEEANKMSKNTKIDVSESVSNLKQVIQDSVAGLTPNERNQVNQLFELATEQGNQLTPSEIYIKSKLFNKLKKQAKFEGLGDVFVPTVDGDKNVFELFRNVFMSRLDEASPKIKGLNARYAKEISLVDAIEDELLKGFDKASAKGIDPAEIIQTRLRSLLSDNQNRPILQNIVDMLDKRARELGYSGAKAYDLIDFATELRNLYPETVPKTSLGGIIKGGGFSGVVGDILDYGTAGAKEQQQALKELITEAINKKALRGLKKP